MSTERGKRIIFSYLRFSKFFLALLFSTVLVEKRMRHSLLDGLILIKSSKLWLHRLAEALLRWGAAGLGCVEVTTSNHVQFNSLKFQCNCFWKYNVFRGRTTESFVSPRVKSMCPLWLSATVWWDNWGAVRGLGHHRAQTCWHLSKNGLQIDFASLSITCQRTLQFHQNRYFLCWNLPKLGIKKSGFHHAAWLKK